MAEQEPGFFARICCCSRNDKEPPVTLIRSADLTAAAHSSISPARETVDGLEEQQNDIPKEEKGPKEEFRGKAPKWKEEPTQETVLEEAKDLEMNMNSVMIDEICGEEEEKPSVEDAVSIRTNVVEEVDESELRQMSEILKKDEETEEKADEPQSSSRSGEIVSLEQMLREGYETPRVATVTADDAPSIEITPAVEEAPPTEREEESEIEEMQEITNSRPTAETEEDSELEEEIIIHGSTESTAPTASPRSILKTSPSVPSTARTESSEEAGETHLVDEKEEEEEDEDLPPPPPVAPPPDRDTHVEGLHHAVMVNVDEEQKKPSSMMYADADTSESDSSDDEAEREVLPPVAKPEDDKTDVEEDENWEEKSEKENKVTRLSLKSNGQATLSHGGVRIALEAVEITDDEFSEKLI